jgi:enamine deaminase RidA (YjgF/YER057c/UK114 family)
MRPSETSRSKFMFDQYVLPPSRLSASGRRPSTGSLIIGIRPVTHLRFRKYNTKDIYPSQALNNDLAMAVRAGNRIWLRGQTGLDLDGNFVGVGDPAAQAENAMCCVKILLEEAGSELPHIVKTTIYLTDRAHREAVYQVVGRWLKGVYPCQTGLIVAGLAKPEMLMEIDVEAVIPSV